MSLHRPTIAELTLAKDALLAERDSLREQVHATFVRGQAIGLQVEAIDYQIAHLSLPVGEYLSDALHTDPDHPAA